MLLVTGSTGNVGSEVVAVLHEQGHDVRALVRDAARAERLPQGIDIAVGDLDDAESVAAAVRGVDGVFLMQASPGTAQTETMIGAVRSADVRKLVVLSSLGAVLAPLPTIGAAFAAREQLLRDSGLGVTYLRPNGMMSNALWWADGIRGEGRVVDATSPGRVSVVDPYDIARVAAMALTEDGHVGHAYLLTGPQALTSREQVEILADALGRSIAFEETTTEELARDSIDHGTPVQDAEAMQNLNEMFRASRAGMLTDDIENLTGTAPRTFRDWCGRHVEAFR